LQVMTPIPTRIAMGPFTRRVAGFYSKIGHFGTRAVTGAKPRAGVEILLAPTRVGSIQPDRDRPG